MCKLWDASDSSYSLRQRRNRFVRKSERIRILELELIRQQYELEYLKATLHALLESKGMAIPELDAGKWYERKPRRDS